MFQLLPVHSRMSLWSSDNFIVNGSHLFRLKWKSNFSLGQWISCCFLWARRGSSNGFFQQWRPFNKGHYLSGLLFLLSSAFVNFFTSVYCWNQEMNGNEVDQKFAVLCQGFALYIEIWGMGVLGAGVHSVGWPWGECRLRCGGGLFVALLCGYVPLEFGLLGKAGRVVGE